jgi:hypothetical protein
VTLRYLVNNVLTRIGRQVQAVLRRPA